MIPPLIVSTAVDMGIHLIAITDHNSSANVQAVMEAAAPTSLVILPGMELQTREEVHSLCIFDTLAQLQIFQEWVDPTLPELKNRSDFFGPQYVVDSSGEFIREETRLLLTSSSLSLEEASSHVLNMGGLFIPAHVNRKANGLLANLGFIPSLLKVSALEVSRHITPAQAIGEFPQLESYPIIQSGDVHRLDEFLAPNFLTLVTPTIKEIQLALLNQEGRSCIVRPNLL